MLDNSKSKNEPRVTQAPPSNMPQSADNATNSLQKVTVKGDETSSTKPFEMSSKLTVEPSKPTATEVAHNNRAIRSTNPPDIKHSQDPAAQLSATLRLKIHEMSAHHPLSKTINRHMSSLQ